MIIRTNDDADLISKNVFELMKAFPNDKIVVTAQSYRSTREIADRVRSLFSQTAITGTIGTTIVNNATFIPIDIDGARIRGLRANHVVLANYQNIPKETSEVIARGFLVCMSNPIKEIKEQEETK